jgi:hypothetical protein
VEDLEALRRVVGRAPRGTIATKKGETN